ncbi:MAG: hypothetical protein ACK4S6_16310 [Roseateles asaccharophilus]|uniref:hypothetical protein n=1 Tax=Roseateles asaccharophilus TaxID=582607 RepID=UPI00391CE761
MAQEDWNSYVRQQGAGSTPSWLKDEKPKRSWWKLALWLVWQAVSWPAIIMMIDLMRRGIPLTWQSAKWWLSLWI